MKKIIIVCVLIFLADTFVIAQDCTVNVDSIKGEYSGGCKKGKADGYGTARGSDTYTGDFKNGYPDGRGKYIWKNGDWYDGYWKKGSFDGQGTLRKTMSGVDSATETTGYWEKGKYIGKYAKPYKLNAQSNAVTGVEIKKLFSGQSGITITVRSRSRSTTVQGKNLLPKYRLTDILMADGRYDQAITDELSSPFINKYLLRNVSFPFRATLVFEAVGATLPEKNTVSFEIFEDGNWSIEVNIDI